MAQHSELTGAQLHQAKPRTNAGSPAGSVTPTFAGELLWDSTNDKLYVATGATSSDWLAIDNRARARSVNSYPAIGWQIDYNTAPHPDVDETVYEYPGIGRANQEYGGYVQIQTPEHGDEADGAGWTSYWAQGLNDTSPQSDSIYQRKDFYYTLPNNFRAWDTNAITLRTKIIGNAGYSGDDIGISLEVLEPTTGLPFAVPVLTRRSVANTTVETGYTAQSITAAQMGSVAIRPGAVLPIRISWGADAAGNGDISTVRIGRMTIGLGG